MKKCIIGSAIVLCLVAVCSAKAAVSVAVNTSATSLAAILDGPGITIVGGSETLIAGSASSGTFTGGTDLGALGIGIPSGILLTTGTVANSLAPNTSESTSTTTGTGADTNLGGFDRTVLEFDFTFDGGGGGDLFFNYVFGSEEYNEFVGTSFNDAFSFFLDSVNIALIPSTSTPVSINTLNSGLNSTFYRNNSPGGPIDTEYDGLTTVLTASKTGLDSSTHHIKLVIVDRGDSSWDSGVYLQGGSFSTDPIPPTGVIPEPGSLIVWGLLGTAGAVAAVVRRRKKTA